MDGLKDKGSIHTCFGTAIHHAIQAWLDLLFNGAKIKSKIFDIETSFKDKLLEEFKANVTVNEDGSKTFYCDQDTLKEFYLDGCAILKHVRQHQKDFFPTEGYELVGCEVPLDMMVAPKVKFVGFVDIIVRHKRTKKITIFDLKTSTKGWFYEKKDPKKLNQLLLYKEFYSKQFDVKLEDIDVQFVILKRKLSEKSEWDKKRISRFEPSQGLVSVNKAKRSFELFVSSVFDVDGNVLLDNLKPTPSAQSCRWCSFRDNPALCSEAYKK